jgi:hypothetical protein
MRRTCSLSLSVPPHTPGVTMDHRVKPGGDGVGSLWSILHVEFESPDYFRSLHKMSRKYMLLYVADFQFQYNKRFNTDMFGAAISGC